MKKTTSQFKRELKKIQPELTVLGDYTNAKTKILVKDNMGIKYMSSPSKLLINQTPTILSAIDKNEAFKIISTNVHGVKYDYKNSVYKDSYTSISINCKKHGKFAMKPTKHMCGQGCKKCANINRGINRRSSTKSFIKKAIKIHKNAYDYSQVNYITAIKKIIIICKKHGNKFEQQPNNHLTGQGCPLCSIEKISNAAKISSYGWSFSKWERKIINNNNTQPRFYLIECNLNDEKFIKAGITMHSVKKRYPGKTQMPYNYKILKEIVGTPLNIHNLEQVVKKEFKKNKFLPIFKFNGMYECYDKNIKNKILNFIDNINSNTH